MSNIWDELENLISTRIKAMTMEKFNDFASETYKKRLAEIRQQVEDGTLSVKDANVLLDELLKGVRLPTELIERFDEVISDAITNEMQKISDKFMEVLNNATFQAKDDILKSLRLRQ